MDYETPTIQKKTFLLIPYLADPLVPVYCRITLAAVIYRNRLGHGATISGLSKLIGFDRNTIKTHIKKLNAYVYSDDGKWFARSPINNDLHHRYKWKKKPVAAEWYRNILTIKLTSLSLPIKHRAAIVPVVLYDLLPNLKPKQTKAGLAKMLGIGRATVDRAITRLAESGWIRVEPISNARGVAGYHLTRCK